MQVNKDTKLCISLAGHPTNFGTRFHNFLFQEFNLNYIYKACTTTDIKGALTGIRSLGIRGAGISMPFKESCIEYLDELDETAKAIMSVNTIVNNDNMLKGYNTDYAAICELVRGHQIEKTSSFILRGSGGMAKAVACAMKNSGFDNGTIVARNREAGEKLASLYSYNFRTEMSEERYDLLINVTPIGMQGRPEANSYSFPESMIRNAKYAFDVVALPVETPLIKFAKYVSIKSISGSDVAAIQAREQFVLYTNMKPSKDQITRAAKFARQ